MNYLKLITLLVVVSLFFLSCKDENKLEMEKYSTEFRGYSLEYMTSLKSVLMKNMKEGGPMQAVSVCSDTASELTAVYSGTKGITIKRVSYKNRNENNAPDEFEKEALDSFAELNSKNELTANAEIIKQVSMNGNEFVRFAKPILVEAPCLVCHGSSNEINMEVTEFLSVKYPNDKATGYKIGDLRGAISISRKL